MKIIIACVLLVIFCGACSNAGGNESSITASTAAQKYEASVLSFTVTSDSWDSSTDGELIVLIAGTDEDGKKVNEQYKAVPDTKYDTDLKPGTYVLSLASAKPTKSERLFTADKTDIDFTGDSSVNAVLAITLDQAAIEAAEAQKKAEAQKAAEAEAKAKQEAEQKAAAESAAAAKSSSGTSSGATSNAPTTNSQNEMTVYIASSGNGKKYHSNPNCSRMKGTISLSVSAAKSKGYGPCSKCM